jgi:predicted esterase
LLKKYYLQSKNEHHIPVTRTARYFTLGELNHDTIDIWFVIHGHRQLAGDFIAGFEELSGSGSFLIAPEGLMRLYVKGDSGDVGASWMTKEDRNSDIKDYVNYLDKLFFEVIEPKARKYNLKINALGFSQGSATLSRWIALGKAKIDKAVFWCGSIAHDIDYSRSENFKQTEIHQVFASKDPYYDSGFPKQQLEILTKCGIATSSHIFDGGHEISVKLMKECSVI